MSATSAAERTTDLLKQLDGEVEALTDSAAWQRYLTMQARLHKYSFGNCLLIAAQRPDASRVAGYQAWRELGRQVRKGESGIRIMVPFVYRKREASETSEEREAYVRFGTGHVFDIAQTDGEEIGGEWGLCPGRRERSRGRARSARSLCPKPGLHGPMTASGALRMSRPISKTPMPSTGSAAEAVIPSISALSPAR